MIYKINKIFIIRIISMISKNPRLIHEVDMNIRIMTKFKE